MAGSRIQLPASGEAPPTQVYANVPAGAQRGMVVIHEMLGMQPEIERVVDRFAAHGIAAAAPALYDNAYNLTCLRAAMATMATGKGAYVDAVKATRAYVAHMATLIDSQIGLIGFCVGGGFALAMGAGWGAVSTNYGDIPKNEELLKGLGPVIGCYGGRDRAFGRQATKLEATLKPLNIEVETHTYPDVGHSFLTDGHHPFLYALSAPVFHITWNKEVAVEAWGHILAFMEKHLQPPPPL